VSYPRDPVSSAPPHPNWYPYGERREDDKDAKVVTQRRYINNWRSTHAGQGWTDLTNSTPQHPLGLNVYEDGSILFRDSARVWLFKNNRDIIPSNFFKYPASAYNSSHTVSMAVYAPKSKSLIVTNYTKPVVEVNYLGMGGSQSRHYPDPQMVISLLQIDSDTNNDTLDFNSLKIIHTAGNVVYPTAYDVSRVHSYGKSDSDIILGSGLRTGYKIEYGVIQADPVEMPIEPFTLAGLSLATNEDASVILFSSGANFKKHVFKIPPGSPPYGTVAEIMTGNGQVHGTGKSSYLVETSPPYVSGLQEFAQVHTVKYSTFKQTTENWAVQSVIPNETTSFLESYGFIGDGTSSLITYDSQLHHVPGSARKGYGNYPSKLWPVSYLTLSPNNQYLSIATPKYNPGDVDSTVSGFRSGDVTIYKSLDSEKSRRSVKNLSLLEVLNKIENGSYEYDSNKYGFLNLYEPLSITMSSDGKTIAIASPFGKIDDPKTAQFPFYEGENYFELTRLINQWDDWVNAPTPPNYTGEGSYIANETYMNENNLRSWVQIYSLVDGEWVAKGKLIKPIDTGAPGRPYLTANNIYNSIHGEFPNSTWTQNGTMHDPAVPDYEPKNFRISLGQFMDMSEDGSRLVVSAMKSSLNSNASGTRNPSTKPEQIHEVYIYEYNSIAGEWTANRTSDGSFKQFDQTDYKTYPERVFVNNLYKGNLNISTGVISNTEDTYLDATQTIANDNASERERHTLGSVSGVAISPNGQRISVSFSNYSSSDLTAGSGTKTSRCVEMVLVFEYHEKWFKYPEVVNATGTLHDRNIGLNVFPRNVNYDGESFGGNIFSAQKVPGWLQTSDPSTKDYEHVYITGGEYANWKLLHWEAFTAELHLDGFTGSNKGLPGYYTRINEVPHSIVSGLKFCGNDAVLIERYDNTVGTGRGKYERDKGETNAYSRINVTRGANGSLVYPNPNSEIYSTGTYPGLRKSHIFQYQPIDTSYYNPVYNSIPYNSYRYPCLLVFDELARVQDASGNNYPTSYTPSTGVKRRVAHTDQGYAVQWAEMGSFDPNKTNNINSIIENEFGGKDGTSWINPITGWLRVDLHKKRPYILPEHSITPVFGPGGEIMYSQNYEVYDIHPESFDETPFSVDVSSSYVNSRGHIQPTRVVFGIPQAANHRGKISVFDVTTINRPIEMNDSTNFRNYDVLLKQVGPDVFGDEVKGRFGENVSMSEDGLRIAVGNRPFYLDPSRGADFDTPVPTKVYICEYDSESLKYIRTVTRSFPVVGPMDDPQTSNKPSLTRYQTWFANTVDNNAYSKYGRPPCLELPEVDVGMQSDGTILYEKPHVIWTDSRYREAKVKLSGDGSRMLVSVFNGFYVYDLGDTSNNIFSEIGGKIEEPPPIDPSTGQPNLFYTNWKTFDQNEFPYSKATFSQDGKTIVVPWAVIPDEFAQVQNPGDYEKKFTIFTLNESSTEWQETQTQTVEGATIDFTTGWNYDLDFSNPTGPANDTLPIEHTYLAILSSDKTRVTSLYMGTPSTTSTAGLSGVPLNPVLRQYLISGTQQIPSWSKIGIDITLDGKDLNRQSVGSVIIGDSLDYNGGEMRWKHARKRRQCAFTMSNSGDKIAIGQDNDNVFYTFGREVSYTQQTLLNANYFEGDYGQTIETGSVTIFTYDPVNTTWKTQKITPPDDESLLNFQGGGSRVQGPGLIDNEVVDLQRRARFGHALAFTKDGNSLVVSAPEIRNGLGTVFFFDTSTEVAREKITSNKRFHNTETVQNRVDSNPYAWGSFGYSLAINDNFTRLAVGVPEYSKYDHTWGNPASGTTFGRVIVSEFDSTPVDIRDITIPHFKVSGGSETLIPYAGTTVGGLNMALLTGKKTVAISDSGTTIAYTVSGDQFTSTGLFLHQGTIDGSPPFTYTSDPDLGLYQRVVVATENGDGNFVARANNIFSNRLSDLHEPYNILGVTEFDRNIRDAKKEFMYVSDDGNRVIYSGQSRVVCDPQNTPFNDDGNPHIFAFYYDESSNEYKEQGLGDVLSGPGYKFSPQRPSYPFTNTTRVINGVTTAWRESTAGFFTTRYPASYGDVIRPPRNYEFSMDKSGNKVVVLAPFERGGTTGALRYFDHNYGGTATQWLWSAGVHTFIWDSSTVTRYQQGTGSVGAGGFQSSEDSVDLQRGFNPEPPSSTNNNSEIVLSTTSQVGTRAEDHKIAMSRDGTKLVLICHVVVAGPPVTSTGTKVSVYEWDASNTQWTFLNSSDLLYSVLNVTFQYSNHLNMDSMNNASSYGPQDVLPNLTVSEDGSTLALEYRQGHVDKRKEVVFDILSSGLIQVVSNFSITTQAFLGSDSTLQIFYGDPQISPRLSRDGSRLFQRQFIDNNHSCVAVYDTATGTQIETFGATQPRVTGSSTQDTDIVFGISQSSDSLTTNIIISSPYENTSNKKVKGLFDVHKMTDVTVPTGFSNQNVTNIESPADSQEINSKKLDQFMRFGECIDISGTGNNLIISRGGMYKEQSPTPARGILKDERLGSMQVPALTGFIDNGGLEVAEIWSKTGSTWNKSSDYQSRIKTDILTTTTDKTPYLYELSSWPGVFPWMPNVKISDDGTFSLFGLRSLKLWSPTSVSTIRQKNQISLMKRFHDTTPSISLVGSAIVEIALGTVYVDQGVTVDAGLTVVISGDEVKTDSLGTYVVRYSVTRTGLSNFVERTVKIIIQAGAPTLTLIGDANVTLEQPAVYTEPDPAATFTGGQLERYGVPPDGTVAGVFTIRYVVRNSLGLVQVQRTVTINSDTTPPVLTIFGGNVVHKVNTNYIDPSYVGSDGNEQVQTITPPYLLTVTDVGDFRGVTQITYSATDQAGNIGTSVRSVTVKDDFEAASVHTISDSHSSALSSTGNRIASMVGQDVSLYETGGALVNTWTGLGSLVGQMVRLNSNGTIVAFTTVAGIYVYEYTTSWVERPPHSSYPRFTVSGSTAFRIELSDDASTLAVSYPGGTTAFAEEVAVFRWNSSAYTLDYNQGSAEIIGLGDSMSLKSDGTRLALGYPNKDFSGGSSITSTRSTFASPYPTRNGVKQLFGAAYKLTSFGQYGSNNTMYWQLNLGSSWTITWEWYIYGPRWGGADDMRLIYFAPNPITAYQASTHGGYNNFYEFWQGDTHQIRDNKDVYKKTQNVYYGTSRWLKVDVSYDNGVMSSTVRELYGRQRLVSTLSHDFGNAHESLYGQSLYFGFSGRTGGVSSSQYLRNINLSTNVPDIGEIEVFDRSGPSNWSQVGGDIRGGLQDQKLGSTVKLSGDGSTLLNVNEGRDGNRQKVSVFTLNSGTWTKNATLLDSALTRSVSSQDTVDIAAVSDDGSMVVYTKGMGTETYATHPNGLASKILDGFKLDGGVYKHALVVPNIPTASTKQVFLAGDKSKVLVQCGTDTSVFDVTQSVFNPVITLTQDDGADPLIVSSYTEQGATSSDGTTVQIGGDSVLSTPGNYRVQYSTSTSGFRIRTVKITP
jgi:hypothetical protein